MDGAELTMTERDANLEHHVAAIIAEVAVLRQRLDRLEGDCKIITREEFLAWRERQNAHTIPLPDRI